MLGSIGYYLSSRTGKFVVTVNGVSEQAALDIVASATLKEFCLQFPSDCQNRSTADLEMAIKTVIF